MRSYCKNGQTLGCDMNEHQNLQVNVFLVIQHSIGGNVKHIGSLVGALYEDNPCMF